MPTVVALRNVVKRYTRGKQKVEVLHSLNLDVLAGEFLALMSPSGSGKTTLLNLIGGLDQPTQGEVRRPGSHHGGRNPRAAADIEPQPGQDHHRRDARPDRAARA